MFHTYVIYRRISTFWSKCFKTEKEYWFCNFQKPRKPPPPIVPPSSMAKLKPSDNPSAPDPVKVENAAAPEPVRTPKQKEESQGKMYFCVNSFTVSTFGSCL